MNKTILFMRLKLLSGSANSMWTGNDLHRFLTSDDVEWAVGLGYVAGHLDNIQKKSKTRKKPPSVPNSADEMPYRKAADLVLQYLQDFPESRHEDASVLINRALEVARGGERQSA